MLCSQGAVKMSIYNFIKLGPRLTISTKTVFSDLKRRLCSSAPTKLKYDMNTNVTNDVVLFKYENPRFYKLMNIFAISQYLFWGYLGYFSYNSLRDIPVDPNKVKDSDPWIRKVNLGDKKYRNGLAAASLLIGAGSLCLVWVYTLKSVRYLILNKGGKHITFVTYAPFGKNRIMKVPINCISCQENRSMCKVQLPLKVKNTWMHYVLDMKGEFKHPHLFDATAGLYRRF